MAVYTGSVSASPLGGLVCPQLTAMLHGFEVDYWPGHTAAMTAPAGNILLRPPSVSAFGRLLGGSEAPTYAGDYYDRVHVVPQLIALGDLVSSQTREILVWNAWRDRTLILNEIDQDNSSGMTLVAPGELPLDFAPLKAFTWSLAISTSGSPTIDATLTWQFAGEQPLAVRVTGNRLSAWFIPPDWSNSVVETLVWMTGINDALNGNQQRVIERELPRRQWEFDAAAAGGDRQLLEASLYSWRGRNWALPVFPDQEVLQEDVAGGSQTVPVATVDLDFAAGGLAMLYQDARHYELAEIESVDADALQLVRPLASTWRRGTRIWPCRIAHLTDTPDLTRRSSNVLRTTVRFESDEPCEWPAIAPATTYLGFPVLEQRPNETGALTSSYDRKLDTLDGDIGLVNIEDFSGLPFASQQHAFWLAGRAARSAHRSLLYWLQGQAQTLWVPTWADDLTMTDPLGAGSVSMRIAYAGVARFLVGTPGRKHIRIELWTGAVYYRRVTSADEIDDETEQVLLDAAIGTSVLAPEDVRQISWMALSTQGTDTAEIHHVTDSEGLATHTTTFAVVPAEEP